MGKNIQNINSDDRSSKNTAIKWVVDIAISMLAASIVAFGLHVFANDSVEFVPGGITGLAKIFSLWTDKKLWWGIFLLILNIPIFILEAIFVDKRLGIILSIYAITQAVVLSLFDKYLGAIEINFAPWERIYAAIAAGVVTGIGYSVQIMRHGASGGTYALSALIKHWNPSANIAWLSFAMDASVIILAYFQFNSSISSVICTFINLFIADVVVDKCLKGTKDGYKFEIITEDPESIAKRLMSELQHGVTEVSVHGMYSNQDKYMVVCIIRKRELSNMMRILKEYPNTFSSFTHVNEVFGKFKK